MLALLLSSRSNRGTSADSSTCSSLNDDNHNNKTNHDQRTTYTITRYYYTQDQRTEQSMDVYEPLGVPTTSNATTSSTATIVFVMGSGWLGHAWWIYTVTNWWNASGPATMAKLGYRCISVRHSGGFFQVPTLRWIVFLFPLVVAMFMAVSSSLGLLLLLTENPEQLQQQVPVEGMALVVVMVVAILFLLIFLQWQGKGAAHLDDMVEDVTKALDYIRHNLKQDKILLGGYSSGGHVVATWLSRQQQQQQTTDPSSLTLESWIQGVLYVSGVLSLDSALMNAVTLTVFGKWARSIPSPYTNKIGTLRLPPPPSTLSHLVIGCRNETFGIPILDATFCAQDYVEQLQQLQQQRQQPVRAKCVLVDSNHWSILNSHALYLALQQHLPWLLLCNETTKEPNKRHPNVVPNLESTASSSTNSSSNDLDGLGSIGGDENEE